MAYVVTSANRDETFSCLSSREGQRLAVSAHPSICNDHFASPFCA
jgi:hypothetical protein